MTNIGNGSFYTCPLTSITFEGSSDKTSKLKRIEAVAFPSAKVTSLTLPDSIEYLGSSFIGGQATLKTIDISNCTKLTNLTRTAFLYATALTTVTLPPNLVIIGYGNFSNASITSLTFTGKIPGTNGRPTMTWGGDYSTLNDPTTNISFRNTLISAIQGNDWQAWAKTQPSTLFKHTT